MVTRYYTNVLVNRLAMPFLYDENHVQGKFITTSAIMNE